MLPLPGRDGVSYENQGVRFGNRHCTSANNGLTRAAGEHHNTRTAGPELLDCLLLITAHAPVTLSQFDCVRSAVGVTSEVLGRPSQLQ